MNETFRFRFLDSKSDNRKLAVLREGESIFEGALDLEKEGGCRTSEPFDQTPFIDGFDLFGHDLGGNVRRATPGCLRTRLARAWIRIGKKSYN